jgi:hypothetical protein
MYPATRPHPRAAEHPQLGISRWMLAGALLTSLAACDREPAPPDACTRWSKSAVALQRPFEQVDNHLYRAPVRSIQDVSDRPGKEDRSPVLLCENGKLIGAPHTQHEEIAKYGGGLFSHWGHSVYFSASDNSDPNSNGREYVLVRPPPTWWGWL